jgi:hypothetical protein
LLTAFLGCCFLTYFIEVQVQYVDFKTNLNHLVEALPQFLDRFRYPILSYSFTRERILNNNSLASFERDQYGLDLDSKYIDFSIDLET